MATNRHIIAKITQRLPGIFFCLLISVLVFFLRLWLPSFGAVFFCLILGMLTRFFYTLPEACTPGIIFCAQHVLTAAIVFLGLSLKVSFLSELGLPVLGILCLVVVLSIASSMLLAKQTHTDKETSLLIGVGTGICGSSAIAACAPFITTNSNKIATSLAVTNFLGIVGIFALPVLAALLGINVFGTSVLLGGTLQSVGHVAAAAGTLGEEVLKTAIAIKMGRIFLLLPTVLTFSIITKKSSGPWIKKIPFYLWGFIAAVIVCNIPMVSEAFLDTGIRLGKKLMMLAMVAIGYEINLKTFFTQASKSLALGSTIFILQVILILIFLSTSSYGRLWHAAF